MPRTTTCLPAVSLALLSLLGPQAGSSNEASVLGSSTPSSNQADEPSRRPLLGGSAEAPRHPAGRNPADLPPLADTRLRPSIGPTTSAVEPPGRPEIRPFWAKGGLAERVSDPSFGPRLRPDDLLTPRPPATLAGVTDLLCIAVAIYHEARNQPLDGQIAVASVILNRTEEPARWGSTPCEVVAPVQFSFMTGPTEFPPIQEPEAWAIAVEMAREALERGPSPLVGQADHYHTAAVKPVWDEGMGKVITIDDHVFFVDASTRG